MTKTTILRGAFIALAAGSLSACDVSDPRLNTGISIGTDGLSLQPSLQANVGGGLLQYTPPIN